MPTINLDSLLHYISNGLWIGFAIFLVVSFLKTAWDYGLVTAFQRIVTVRLGMALVTLISISLLSLSFVFIEPQYSGVVVSLFSQGGIRDERLPAGVHWIFPLAEQIETYPIFWQTYTMSGRPFEGEIAGNDAIIARTSDGQEVLFDVSIIFRLDTDQIVRIHVDWQNRYIKDFIRPTVRGFVRTEVSAFTVDEVNSKSRQILEEILRQKLIDELADKGLIMDQFIIRNISFSSEYAEAVEQKQVALEAVVATNYEAQQIENLAKGRSLEIRRLAEAQAAAVITQTKAEATAIVLLANADADAIRVKAAAQAEALALIEEVIKDSPNLLTYEYIVRLSPNIKVMLLPNDAPFILDLPGLEEGVVDTANRQSSSNQEVGGGGEGTVTPESGDLFPNILVPTATPSAATP